MKKNFKSLKKDDGRKKYQNRFRTGTGKQRNITKITAQLDSYQM